ncbi:Oidioi.mRNA.OKI2018_I69.PAR.g11118.t1.cds [Oikopleura dioica]|uniref:Oidioi.mRNA.OKI2018_I69.PAR.g11118.t1.cds n=1 Tax=Oikopleura dioica TaxID=34765 RepID=A0ABN7RU51_OIKDI|nr:Oidioi.mRNA.OKI2018_I69.PAR.g11118.t1.cds [Oikopleura dioica]
MRVKGDRATEKYRSSGIDIVFNIFNELTKESDEEEMQEQEEIEAMKEFRRDLADKIEAAVYRKNKSLVNKKYRRQMRKLAVKLKNEPDYAVKILSEEISPEDVAQDCVDIENGAGKRQALIEI